MRRRRDDQREPWIRGTLPALGCALALSAGCHGRALAPGSAGADSELTLEVTPMLSGSRRAVLRTGDEVASGDGIQIAIKPTVDAHVYVAYCDRSRRLTIFPQDGGLAAPARKITHVPPGDARIILDDEVGPEVLYVIASRRPLDVADPELAAALSRARPDTAAECGEPLDQAIQLRADPPAAGAGPPRAAAGPAEPSRPSVLPATRPHSAPAQKHARSRVPRPVSLERGAFIRWGAAGNVAAGGDRNDIVVLRYGFTHVAGRVP